MGPTIWIRKWEEAAATQHYILHPRRLCKCFACLNIKRISTTPHQPHMNIINMSTKKNPKRQPLREKKQKEDDFSGSLKASKVATTCVHANKVIHLREGAPSGGLEKRTESCAEFKLTRKET